MCDVSTQTVESIYSVLQLIVDLKGAQLSLTTQLRDTHSANVQGVPQTRTQVQVQ